MGQGIRHFIGTMARESTLDKVSTEGKKIQGFSHVFTFGNFKKAFMSDMKQW
jgi:hypothetical protein